MLTAERLREVLHYDPDTGVFTWRVAPSRRMRAGSRAGTTTNTGYVHIRYDGGVYLGHRLAWFYVHGRWPSEQIDHVNGVRVDNRLTNLRECSSAENHQNLKLSPRNTSGHPGVYWNVKAKRWHAQITAGGHQKHLGHFTDLEEAAEAYRIAKAKYHTFQPETRSAS